MIIEYLNQKRYQYRMETRPSGPNAIMNCPKCGDTERKFAINTESGAFRCLHANKCGWSGSWRDFQEFHGDKPKRVISDRNFKKPVRTYNKPIGTKQSEPVMDFFKNRGISASTVAKFKIGQIGNEIALNYYLNGELINVKYRSVTEKRFRQEKNCEPILYGMDNIPDEAEELIILEGEFDVLAMNELDYPSVSINGGVNDTRWIEHNWSWLERFKKIYLCFDMDEAGRSAIGEVAKRLGMWRCYEMSLPYKDVNESLLRGVSHESIGQCILDAKGFDRDEIINATEKIKEVSENILHPESKHGAKIGVKLIDEVLCGLRPGELTVITGRSGSGKTTACIQMLVENAYKNYQPTCIGSFEMDSANLLTWAALQILRKSPITENNIKKAMELMSEVYIVDIKGVIEVDNLIDIYTFAARKYGCKHFLIDSLMRLSIKGFDKYEAQDEAVNRLVTFADEYQVHVYLVAHPRKGQTDEDKPGKVDVKGSSGITDNAHNVISVYRLSPEQKNALVEKNEYPYDSQWRIHKNRLFGHLGYSRFNFNYDHKYFKELNDG